MDPELFLADLDEKPARLAALAQHLRATDPWAVLGEIDAPVLLLGMGSSHYANQVAAARLRSRGVPAVAELAASDLLPALRPGTWVIAVSASGGSAETLDAVRRLRQAAPAARFVALTNRSDTELGGLCDVTVDVAAGDERGGVACRSFQHTLALLLALEERLSGGPGSRPLSASQIPTLLEHLRRKELVEPTGAYWGDEPIHRFHHVLIRDAAYRRLLKGSRAALHQRVGEWTDATSGHVIGEHEAAIAFHYEQAVRYRSELGIVDEDTDRLGRRAAELLRVASTRALERDDLASAGALAGRALAVLRRRHGGPLGAPAHGVRVLPRIG